jgi:hypothetical protein
MKSATVQNQLIGVHRYKTRQFAERLPDGKIPVAGFSNLSCESSKHVYARTIARCLFFLARQPAMEPHASRLKLACEKNLPHDDTERVSAIQSLIFAGLCEGATGEAFALEEFIELYYVVAPNGIFNRSAQFVTHIAVHVMYCCRGVYLLQCADNYDTQQHQSWSESILNEQNDNAWSAIQSLKRVAVLYTEEPECKIVWLSDGLEVRTIRGNKTVTALNIRAMYRDFVQRSEAILIQMKIPILSAEELEKTVDLNSREVGQGIMSMNSTIFETRCSGKIGPQHRGSQERKDFCHLSYELGKLLILGLYLSGGPSSRLTEIANWLVALPPDNSLRNLRFVRNLIVVVNSYSKGGDNADSKGDLNLACYSDLKLTALVLTYLIHVKRLECEYSHVFGPEAQRNSRLCFLVHNGNLVSGKTLGVIFRHEFLAHELDVSIADMRQVLEAYARKIGCLMESEVRKNPLLQLSNHSSATSNQHYGKSKADLPHIPADRMEECYLYCMHWNSRMLNSDEIVAEIPASLSATGGILHSSIQLFGGNISCAQSSQFDAVTQQYGVPSVRSIMKRGREIDYAAAMKLLGMKQLKPTQARAFDHLQEHRDSHSLIILPTGTGKSKLIALDAIARDVCNVLFVPYVAIKEDVQEESNRFKGLRVANWSCIRADFETTANSAHIVVASFEHAGQSMISFFQMLHKLKRLGSCFVDEADVMLHAYRAFKHFWSLAASCNLVTVKAMTATLRPRDEADLSTMLGVNSGQLVVLREPSVREDIQLSVRFFQSDEGVLRGLQGFIGGVMAQSGSRVIIFVMTIREAEELGTALKAAYSGQVSISHSRRRELLKRIAVVTSCFTHGVNIIGLTHIAILRSCWSVEAFVQAMGRLRQPGTCTVFTSTRGLEFIVSRQGNAYAHEMATVLMENRDPAALKVALSELLDKPVPSGAKDALNPSDANLKGRSPFRFEVFVMLSQKLQVRVSELAVAGTCTYCTIVGRPGAESHTNEDCQAAKGLCNKCYSPGHNRLAFFARATKCFFGLR